LKENEWFTEILIPTPSIVGTKMKIVGIEIIANIQIHIIFFAGIDMKVY
jgi:hypothetical protein